jgi:DNA-binding transcriptional regulator GbsR (MarR family)
MGIQDAPRKRRPPSQSPGACAGGVFCTKDGKITKSILQEKWDKAKAMIKELIDEANNNPTHEYLYKRLEQIRGFLCHLAMTYENITPFLKGLHLTLASYLPQRDAKGWKLSYKEWLKRMDDCVKAGKVTPEEAFDAIEEERWAQIPEIE